LTALIKPKDKKDSDAVTERPQLTSALKKHKQ